MNDVVRQRAIEAEPVRPAAEPEALQQKSAPGLFANSPRLAAQRRTMNQLGLRGIAQRVAEGDEEELPVQAMRVPAQRVEVDEGDELPLQGRFANAAVQRQTDTAEGVEGPQQTQVDESRGGLPAQLRAGIEALSGMDMSGVRVHRNSDKPAQLSALAYAQGNDIHLGPGRS